MTETTYSRQKIFRKKLVMPTEHGAWAWLLIPFVVGAVVASKIGSFGERASLSLLLAFIGGLCAFFDAPTSYRLAKSETRQSPSDG